MTNVKLINNGNSSSVQAFSGEESSGLVLRSQVNLCLFMVECDWKTHNDESYLALRQQVFKRSPISKPGKVVIVLNTSVHELWLVMNLDTDIMETVRHSQHSSFRKKIFSLRHQ